MLFLRNPRFDYTIPLTSDFSLSLSLSLILNPTQPLFSSTSSSLSMPETHFLVLGFVFTGLGFVAVDLMEEVTDLVGLMEEECYRFDGFNRGSYRFQPKSTHTIVDLQISKPMNGASESSSSSFWPWRMKRKYIYIYIY